MVQEKLRAVFYARVSTEEERQLNALEKQVAECKDAVLQNGWKLVDQYVDEGKSGTQIKRRDEYKRLFEDLENDKFDIVVIKSQDRLQRNTLDWYIWIDRLTTHGKRLYMYLEDTFYSPDNALISGIKAILAEEYSRELSKKINNSYKRRIEAAKNGEKISIVNNSRSLGYDKVNGELVINEKEAEVVRMIFNMYASGEGLRAISNTLYDMGYKNRSGNEIDPTTISRMLSSEKYKGVYVINQRHYDFDTKKTVLNPKSEWVHIPGAVPAIVEPELWDRVQEIKGSKVQSIKNEKRGRNCGKSIFSGKIYCAKCGAKYWRSLENGYVKFKCSSYSKYGKIPGKGCDNKSFSENALYSILQSLSEQIVEVNTAEVRKSLLNWLESLRERLRASQGDDTIKEEIRKQTARKEKLTDAYMDGIISKEDYSKRYKELEKTLEDLKDKLLTLEVNEDLQSIEEVIQNIDKEMEEYLQTQSFNESRVEFLNQHLTKVTVNKDYFLLEFDLIGGAILTGKDFYLFVDNPRTDIYALGRTLQWILEKKQRKRKKSYSPLGRILEKCTRQDPDERFQNVAEVKKAFRDYLHITRRMSLFSALMIITVSVLGSIEISIQDEQKREQLYQTYLSQKDISDYKSAIFLFPGREEGYQQFLESIMEDGQMDRQEHQELMSLLFYTESDLQKNRRAYHRFAGQLSVIYHFFYAENGGEQYAENWIEKFIKTKDDTQKDGAAKDKVPQKATINERMEQQKKEEEEMQQIMDLYREWFQKNEITEEEVQEWKRGVSNRKETME